MTSNNKEPLQLCPVEKWSELEEIFQVDLAKGLSCLLLLQMQRYILDNGLDHGCKVFCPYGDGKNGIVALNLKNGLNEVIVQCPYDNTSKLEEVLKTTGLISWGSEMEIPFVPAHVMRCIRRVVEHKKIDILQSIPTITFVLDKSSLFFDITLPPRFSFELLSLEHVKLLETTWPHRYEGCSTYFALIVTAKLGYGLFKDGKLVSWVLVRETGALLHLFTVPEERRKGYGELVLKLISNVLLKDEKYVVAFCKKSNVNAANLYKKLNFLHMSDIEWCTIKGHLE